MWRKNHRNLNFIGLLLLCLYLIACKSDDPITTADPDPKPEEKQYAVKFLALGDSYTIGSNIDAYNNWPNQLSRRLEDLGYPLDTTAIIARIGWTTADLIQAI